MPSGGGNYIPDNSHPPQKYGTHVYHSNDLDRPVAVIEAGPFPETICFDAKHERLLTQNFQTDLVVFNLGGTRLKVYRFVNCNAGVNNTVRIVLQPGGDNLLVTTGTAMYFVDPAVPETKPAATPKSAPARPKFKIKAKSREVENRGSALTPNHAASWIVQSRR